MNKLTIAVLEFLCNLKFENVFIIRNIEVQGIKSKF